MARYLTSIESTATAEQAFDLIAGFSRITQWDPGSYPASSGCWPDQDRHPIRGCLRSWASSHPTDIRGPRMEPAIPRSLAGENS